MSKSASYIVNFSGNTPSASEHSGRVVNKQSQELKQQTLDQVEQDTDLQYQPDPSGDEHATSNLDGTPSQMDVITAHEDKYTSRNATYNHDHDHATSRNQVYDTTFPTVEQALKENTCTLGSVVHDQDTSLAAHGRDTRFQSISDEQFRDDAAATMVQVLRDKQDNIQTTSNVNDHNNTSPTMLATLRNQAFASMEGSIEILRKDFNADSHELAYEVPEARGATQTEYPKCSNAGITRDIGWHKTNIEIPNPLIDGYTNGELFAFIRRFNKDVFDVKAVPIEITSGLDLNDARSQDHAEDKVALHLQRVYLSVVLSIASLSKQISRLRSWKETRRTSIFCVIYFAAWLFDMLMPLVLGSLILMVSSIKARNAAFPPAPRALVNIRTGGVQKPQAGLLATNDSLTGASEKQPYEAIEEEAANFVENVRHNIQRAVGMHNNQQQDECGVPLEGKMPKPINKAFRAVQSAGSAPGHVTECTDQTQQPMEEIIWAGINPESIAKVLDIAPHMIGELADNWERFANALSPKPPFSRFAFLRIVSVLAPSFLVSLRVNYYMIYKVIGFAVGFAFFGDPMLSPTKAWLKRNVPNYLELAQPKNNILRGVPTNTQIAITLLRIGEAHKSPLPPVPTSKPSDPDHENFIDAENIPVDATRSDVLDATMPSTVEKAQGDENEEKSKHKHLSNVVRFFKGNTKFYVQAKLAIDHIRAATGSQKAKGHLGVLPKTKSIIYAGPSEYQCRYEGKRGWAVITESAKPSLLFTRDDPRLISFDKLEPVLEIAVEDIKRMKRATAFVNSAIEAVVGFSSDRKLLSSLEIENKEGKTWRLTAIPERDELFNRLVAIGTQRWENM